MLSIQQSFVSQVLAVAGEQIESNETRFASAEHQFIKLRLAFRIKADNLTINDSTSRDECIADLQHVETSAAREVEVENDQVGDCAIVVLERADRLFSVRIADQLIIDAATFESFFKQVNVPGIVFDQENADRLRV